MTDQAIFSDDNNQQNTTPATPDNNSNPFADKLKVIKNEKGEQKYNSVEDALEALNHSQQFIETLKAEKAEEARKAAELEAELRTRRSLEDVVNSLTAPTQNQAPKADQQEKDKGLNEDKVLELVQQALSTRQKAEQETSNLRGVVEKLSETFGDKTREIIVNRAKELGTTPSALEGLAKQNPQLVLSLFSGVNVQNTQPVKTSQTQPKLSVQKNDGLPTTDKRIIQGGATTEEIMDVWNSVKNYTYGKLGVEN